MATQKNFRHGHRERVRDRFLREGLSAFADYEVLELLLFYAIPRRDTKEQAHALCDAFGSLYGTLSQETAALCRTPGIGTHTALFLRSLYPFLRYAAMDEPHRDTYLDNDSLAKLIFPRVNREEAETALVVFMTNGAEIVCVEHRGKGKCYTQIATADLAASAYAYRASSVVLVDYKKVGIPFPSSMLLEQIQHFKTELSSLGVTLRDYLLFTDTQYSSLFLLTGGCGVEIPSPFFFETDARCAPLYDERSERKLFEILSFVTAEEMARSLTKKLLSKFGAITTVLFLPYETLLKETEGAASECLYLKVLSEVYSRAEYSRVCKERSIYLCAHEIGKMFSAVIGMNSEETIALAMFDKDMRLCDLALCARGSVNTAAFALRTLIETAVSRRAKYVAVAHNHPAGLPTPSVADGVTTADLYTAFRQAKISYIDHFVVSRTGYVAISRMGYESYTDMPPSFYEKPLLDFDF